MSLGGASVPARDPRWIRRRSGVAIALFSAALIAALFGEADRDRASWFGHEGPACPLRAAIGERGCPGCGLSRATVLTAHGRFDDAYHVNPAGLLIPLFAMAGILVHADILRRGAATRRHEQLRRVGRIAFVIALIAATIIRLLTAS